MKQILWFALLMPSIVLAGPQEPEWALLLNGCVPMQSLGESMPPLSGVKTPEKFLEKMLKLSPDERIFGIDAEEAVGAKLVPFIDKLDAPKELQKGMTKKNALVLVMKGDQGQFVFMTSELCKALFAPETAGER